MTTLQTHLDALIPEMPFAFFFLVFGPHVGPMQAVCSCNVLTEEPRPPWAGGGWLEKGAHTTPPSLGAMFHAPNFVALLQGMWALIKACAQTVQACTAVRVCSGGE